jgi:hypothetical protein
MKPHLENPPKLHSLTILPFPRYPALKIPCHCERLL